MNGWKIAALTAVVLGVGVAIGYGWQYFGGEEKADVVVEEPAKEPQSGNGQSGGQTGQTGGQTGQTGGQTGQTGGQQGGPVAFQGYAGSGTLSLKERNLTNNAFQLERLDWEEGRTLSLTAKMRAFEAVGYVRVKDAGGLLVEPETVLRAREGAPAWSDVRAILPLKPEYRGQTLTVEFYVKSANDGSRTDILPLKIRPE